MFEDVLIESGSGGSRAKRALSWPVSFALHVVLIGGTPECLRLAPKDGASTSCKIALLDLNGDGAAEVLVREGPSLDVFTQVNGVWTGDTDYIDIGSQEADFDAGKLRATPSKWNDILIGDTRVMVNGFEQTVAGTKEPAQTPTPPPSK